MQYLILMHANAVSFPSDDDWDSFFTAASQSGFFRGGSAVAHSQLMGNGEADALGESVSGFMRFDADDFSELSKLLEEHPTVTHGGTIEIFEMPAEA